MQITEKDTLQTKYGKPVKIDPAEIVEISDYTPSTKYSEPEKIDPSLILESNDATIGEGTFSPVKEPEVINPNEIAGEYDISDIPEENEYDTDPEKRKIQMLDRITDIDAELTTLYKKETDLLKGLTAPKYYMPGIVSSDTDEITKRDQQLQEVRTKIQELKTTRYDLKKRTKVFTNTEKKELADGSSMLFDNEGYLLTDFKGLLKKGYTVSDINYYYNQQQSKAFSDMEKEEANRRYKDKNDVAFLFSWKGYTNLPVPEINITVDEGKDLNTLFDKVTSGSEWNGANQIKPVNKNDRINILIKSVQDYVETKHPDMEPDKKKRLVYEYSKYMSKKFYWDKNDNKPSIEAMQGFAENQLFQINKNLEDINSKYTKLKKAQTEGKLNNQQEYLEYINNERMILEGLKTINEEIINTPNQRAGVGDITSMFSDRGAFGSTQWIDLLTGGISAAQRMSRVHKTSEKMLNGEYLSWAEQQLLETNAVFDQAQGKGTKGTFYQVIEAATEMVPYLATFGISKALVYNPVKYVTQKAMSKVIPQSLMEKGITVSNEKIAKVIAMKKLSPAKIASDWVPRLAGATAQAGSQMQYTSRTAYERMIPEISVDIDEDMAGWISTFDKNTGEKPSEAWAKAFLTTFGEFGTEHSGMYIDKLRKTLGRTVNTMLKRPIPEKYFIESSKKLFGYKSTKDVVKAWAKNAFGWDDVVREYEEELANQIFTNSMTGDGYGSVGQFLEQQLVTALTVGVVGLPINLANATYSHARYGDIGDDVAYTRKDKNGKKTLVRIPKVVHDQIMNVFNEGPLFDPSGLYTIIDKYVKTEDKDLKLNEDQVKFIIDLSTQKQQKNYERYALITALNKAGIKTEEILDKEEVEGTEKDTDIPLSSKDVTKIMKKNRKKFAKKYPLLYQENLLPRDVNTGQMLDPTPAYLLSVSQEIDQELQSAITPQQKAQLEYHKGIVEAELEDIVDKISLPFNYRYPSEKHEELINRIDQGEKLEGNVTLVAPKTLLLTLNDGSQVNVYIGSTPGIKETDEQYQDRVMHAQNTSRNNIPVQLIKEAKEEWNPNNEAFETTTDRITGQPIQIPYGDRIKVMSEGKMIGAVEVHNYGYEKIKSNRYRKAVEIAEEGTNQLIKNLMLESDGQKLNDKEKARIRKIVEDLIYDLNSNLNIEVSETLPWLKKRINENPRLNDFLKGITLNYIDENSETIVSNVMTSKLAAQGFKTTVVPLDLSEIYFESTEAVGLSSAQKLADNLATFFPIFKKISEDTQNPRETVEMEFFKLAKLNSYESVTNKDTYADWLAKSRTENKVNNDLIDYLIKVKDTQDLVLSYEKMVSAFDFYGNLVLVKQFGKIIDKTGLKNQDLNPSQSYEILEKTFLDNLERLDANTLRLRITAEQNESKEIFNTVEWNWSEQIRYENLIAQHEKDLKLLKYITGIDEDVWRQYFTKQTGETKQLSDTNESSWKEFETYDQLMHSLAYRKSKNAYYLWRQSNLIFNLYLTSQYNADIGTFKQVIKDFFLESRETSAGKIKTFSNLYKLSTVITGNESTALSGTDIKGDTFSSFQQNNNIFVNAENVQNSVVNNGVVNYYKSSKKPMQIVIMNGLHNRIRNKFEKGTPSPDLSMEDIWVILMHNFSMGSDTYLQNIGQFADKPYLYALDVPKVTNPSAEQLESVNQALNGELDNVITFLRREVVMWNPSMFDQMAKSYPSNVPQTDEIKYQRDKVNNFLKAFVYNYVINQKDVNEFFFGVGEYPNAADLYKRAGSSNSPGYTLDTHIEGGVGKTFRYAVINEKIINFNGKELTTKGFDGCVFFLDRIGKKIQVSMGSIYAKTGEYPTLTTMKALMSWQHSETNQRGLVKGNWLNIETLRKMTYSDTYKAIQDFMLENNIEVLAVDSSAKKIDEGEVFEFFDKDGNVIKDKKPQDKVHIFDKPWSNVFVQQDLRHSIVPKTSKMPSQNLTTMLSLANGNQIVGLTYNSQKIAMDKIFKQFEEAMSDEVKRKWLIKNTNQKSQPELYALLQYGLTVHDPVYKKMMRKIIASALTREALELPINRTVTIEIPDVDGLLDPMRKVTHKGQEYSLLPDCAACVPGGRGFDYRFKGKPDEAIVYVKENAYKYRDLFDANEELMEWEIAERDGVIPGEPVFLTRVPNSGFSTFDVARLKINFEEGNFSMVNRVGQVASSSDFDGDMRYIQTMYKRVRKSTEELEEGEEAVKEYITFFDTEENQEGISNQIMRLVIRDYANPKYFDNIIRNIDTNAYDNIVNKIPHPTYQAYDPRAFQDSRLNNKVGLDMKGGMTNLLTVFSIISRYHIPIRTPFQNTYYSPDGVVKMPVDRIAVDEFGAIRAHLENFLTMFFDNQKDPKVERMGFNEITGNMFTLLLIANTENDSRKFKNFDEHYNHILSQIEKQVKYFTSPLMQNFIQQMRNENGGMRSTNHNSVFKDLERISQEYNSSFSKDDVQQLRNLWSLSRELSDIKALHTLTQKAPSTWTEYVKAVDLVEKAKANNPEDGFKLFDLRNLLDNDGKNFVNELKIVDEVIKFARENVFDDVIENTEIGKQVYDYIFNLIGEKEEAKNERKKKRKYMTDKEMNAISSTLNNVFNIRAIGLNMPFSKVQDKLLQLIPKLINEYKDNRFLDLIHISKETGTVGILPVLMHAKIFETTLDRARNDFDELPEEAKNLFATYQIEKYGTSTVTSNGGFYTLFGPDYKVELSKKAREEYRKWENGELDPMERLAVAEWVIRGNRSLQIRSLQDFNTTSDRLVDFRTDPSLQYPIHRDVLEGIESIEDVDQFNARYGKSGMNVFSDIVFQQAKIVDPSTEFEKSYMYLKKAFRKWLPAHLSERRARAERYFPRFVNPTDQELKDMYEYDRNMNLVMTFDNKLSDYIFTHLKEQFPDIQIFTDRQAFYDYVRRNTTRSIDVDINAVGHAFRSAIFIDPSKPIQEAMFHEYAHIYWDNLPNDNKVKQALFDLYSEVYSPEAYTLDEIEERIIRDIGRAGTDSAANFINSTILDRWLNLLKEFWNQVKIFFGKYEKTDLLNNMVYSIWHNQHNINPNSRQGISEIHNLVINDYDVNNIIANEELKQYKVGGERMFGITNVIDFFKYDKFDADATLQQKVKSFERFIEEEFKRKATDEEVYEYVNYTETKWWDNTKAGNVIHQVAAEVFEGIQVPTNVIANEFAGNSAEGLRASLTKLKYEILGMYPNAKFYTEMPVTSPEYKIFGYADLIVDIGDNKLLLYDFKTTDKEYKNPDGTLTEYYKRTFSFLMPPLTKIKQSKEVTHKLQLAIEATILESQQNDLNPGEKNTVVGTFVVPILRTVEKGKITSAYISNAVLREGEGVGADEIYWRANDNLVEVNLTKNLRKNAVDMMKQFNARNPSISESYNKLRDVLDNSDVPFPIADKLLEGYHYLTKAMDRDLGDVTHEDIEGLRANFVRGMYNKLLALNWTSEDINTFPLEVLVNSAANGISRAEFEVGKDTYYTEVNVGSDIVNQINPKYSERQPGWHHLKISDKDIYFQDKGVSNVKIGDEVLQVKSSGYEGKVFTDYSTHIVIAINKKGRFVKLKNTVTGELLRIDNIDTYEGLLVIDKDNEYLNHTIVPNYFEPKYIQEVRPRYERHWKYDKSEESFNQTSEGAKSYQRHLIAQKIVWKFFNKYDTKDKLIKVGRDKDEMKEFFSELYSLKTSHSDVADNLMMLLQEALMNHIMAEQIRLENAHGPQKNMPMTLNLYKIITNKKDAVFKDLGGYNSRARFMHPARKIHADYVALDWFMMGLEQNLINVHAENYDLSRKVNDIINKLNSDRLIIEVGNRLMWKMPDSEGLTKEEKEFLTLIYDHYYSRVPLYIGWGKEFTKDGWKLKENGYPRQIPVTRMHATKQEVMRKIGKHGSKLFGTLRWGSIIWDIVNETTYDNIKFKIDKKTVTWKDIKEQFILENASDEEIKDWMGNRGQYFFRHIPFIRSIESLTKGKLYHHYIQAKKIYKNGDDLNPPAAQTGYKVNPIGDRKVIYETKLIIESELKVIESNIFAYHMKDMIAPLDFVLAGYKDKQNAYDYIKDYVEKIMFHKSPELGTEWTALSDAFQQLTSLRFISFSPMTQVFNFAAGQSHNIIREPGAYALGLKRMATNVGVVKAINILRRHGLGNLVDEGLFDTMAKRAGVDFAWGNKSVNLSIETFKRIGYLPMEIIERLNQFPIFVGLMTQEELESYNTDGSLKEGHIGLTDPRARAISERVRDVQGDYGPNNAAPAWLSNTGGLMMQFFKWAPTLIDATIMPYHFTRDHMIRSGIIPTVKLMFKIMKFKAFSTFSERKRYDYLRKALMRWPSYDKIKAYNEAIDLDFENEKEREKRKIDIKKLNEIREQQSEYLHGVTEYMQMLIAGSQNGNIEMKQLSDQDMRNLVSAIIKTILFVLVKGALLIDGNKEKQELAFGKDSDEFWNRFLTRYYGDMFIFIGFTNAAFGTRPTSTLLTKLEKPIVAVDFLVKLTQFNAHFWPATTDVAGKLATNTAIKYGLIDDKGQYIKEWWRPDVAIRKRDTEQALEGDPLALFEGISLIPSGSALNYAMRLRVRRKMNQPFLQTLRDTGYPEELTNKIAEYVSEDLTYKEGKKYLDQIKAIQVLMKEAALNEILNGNGSETIYRDFVNATKLFKQINDYIEGAAAMQGILLDHELDNQKLEYLFEASKQYRETMKNGLNQTDKEKLRRYYMAKEIFDQNPGMFDASEVDIKKLYPFREKSEEPEKTGIFELFKTKK